MIFLILQKKADLKDKLKNLNKKFTTNKVKHFLLESELKKLQDKIEKLEIYDSSFLLAKCLSP